MKNFKTTDRYVLYVTFLLAARLTLWQFDSNLNHDDYWHAQFSIVLMIGRLVCSMGLIYLLSDWTWKYFSGQLNKPPSTGSADD